MDDLSDCLLGCLGLMLISDNLYLVAVFVSLVWELYLDVKVAAYLGDVGASFADNLGVMLAVNIENKCETTQLLWKKTTHKLYIIHINTIK